MDNPAEGVTVNEIQHRHAPRCCCFVDPPESADHTCPLCPNHGELAQLGNNATCGYYGCPLKPGHESDHELSAHTRAQAATLTTEYPCCHQLEGRPHTDYCPTRCGHAPLVPLGPLGGRPDAWHTGSNDQRGPHLRTQCHPDTCGMHPLTMTPEQAERVVAQGMHTAPAKAAQPTIDSWPLEDIPDVDPWTAPLSGIEVRNPDRTTMAGGRVSQAPSHTGHPVGRRDIPGPHHADDCPMRFDLPTGPCICGREGERDTPSTTPTPGVAVHPDCGHPDWPDCPHYT